MKHLALVLCLGGTALPVSAGVREAVSDHILPGFERFASAATALERSAGEDCRAAAVQPAYQAVFDVWMAVADLRIGPSEAGALSVAFWPDDRGFTPRALSALIAGKDPVVQKPDAYAEVSVAARGLLALDMLLYDAGYADYEAGDYTCRLVRAVAADLARQAQALDDLWSREFAQVLINAGQPDNAIYMDEAEALRALYTQLLGSLEFTADSRLGRPMGTFARARPKRAEAWRSGRSLRNVVLSVEAAQALAHALSDRDLPETDAAVAQVRSVAGRIADGAFQDIDQPQARLRVEVLQQAVRAMRDAIASEIGAALGIAPGFNSQDGD